MSRISLILHKANVKSQGRMLILRISYECRWGLTVIYTQIRSIFHWVQHAPGPLNLSMLQSLLLHNETPLKIFDYVAGPQALSYAPVKLLIKAMAPLNPGNVSTPLRV